MLLLTNYRDQGDLITFPCIVQEKVDGVRCLIRNGKGISRSGKEISNIEHILTELSELGITDSFDGEVWCQGMTLYEITGLLNKRKLSSLDQQKVLRLRFNVFDIKMPGVFSERMQRVELHKNKNLKYTKFIDNILCHSRDAAIEIANTIIADGGEGIVLRNLNGLYTNGRTTGVQKYKAREDEEFSIVGYEISEAGYLIWKCITDLGHVFRVTSNTAFRVTSNTAFRVTNTAIRVTGTNTSTSPETCVGKQLTVQYMSKDPGTGIPREGVAKCIKN